MIDPDEIPVNIGSGFGAHSKQGFVSWQMADRKAVQLSSAEARRIAGMLLDAASAADGDAFLMAWAQESLDIDERQAAQLMLAFRRWREVQAREEESEQKEDHGHAVH